MGVPLFVVDAFTDVAYRGNPAAVVLLERSADTAWMHDVAAEMNLSETAFCSPRPDGEWDLRWFTPLVEVDLCGHATLATAHVLLTTGRAHAGTTISFFTRLGTLTATPLTDGRVELDLPAKLLQAVTPAEASELLAALGVESVEFVGTHPDGYRFVVLTDESAVRSAQPDFVALARLGAAFTVTITAPADDQRNDFVSRYFLPGAGIDEDPVTGSAHCLLGPYWSARLGKPVVTGLQVSARTGIVECEPAGDRVRLRGHAVLVTSGELFA